jgi:hypothetical protein
MASITDKITDTRNNGRPVSTTATGVRNKGGTYLECVALTGWSTASKVHFVTYKIDSNNKQIENTQQDCVGIVSGNAITQMSVIDGADIGNEIGDVVEMLPTAAWAQDLADALTNQHTRTGAHGNITTGTISSSDITTIGDVSITGDVSISGSLLLNGISLAAIMYPVGSLYLTTVSTNPATIFGFGTWVAHAKGQALVGKADSGTFATAGSTGGAETVTLTSAQSGLKSHTHTGATYGAGAHNHSLSINWGSSGGAWGVTEASGKSSNGLMSGWMGAVGDHAHSVDVYGNSASDAASAHSILQPYLVIYVWKRTA